MRLTITRQNLQRGLAAVSASIPGKTTLPVLSNVLIESEENSVWISGTDLDVSIRVRVPAEVTQGGAITAPGRKLLELTRELPDQPVELRGRGHQLEIGCGNSRFKLNGLPSEEFPNLPAMDFEEGWTVSEESLRHLIRATSFAVSNEESRPILNGVYWELDDRMTMVATNGHRLAKMEVEAAVAGRAKGAFIIPPAALAQVERLFDGDGEITVGKGGNHLGFRSVNQEVYTRLIEGSYPNYEQVIPKDNDKVARVDKDALEATVRRMAVLASDQTHPIKMSFEPDRVHLDVMTPDLGEAHDELELGYEGEALRIGFNANYLIEVLRNMPDGEVKVAFKTAERAATIVPAESELDYLCLVMPLRLVD
ncbi:MAG: DNA polymerase III subunit beta [Gemmatimonadetes bacterium]|nr:DNA polymerase III subunit beta [Gemmatimonadota bacterium]MYB98626.1 DNA polymerase III subunit beta [Gemmatimonadota bacterium]MYI46640.1 DNA polymerase III subunit beta [Gemmatimonadota bacterium]